MHYQSWSEYLGDLWNYIDVITSCFVLASVILDLRYTDTEKDNPQLRAV